MNGNSQNAMLNSFGLFQRHYNKGREKMQALRDYILEPPEIPKNIKIETIMEECRKLDDDIFQARLEAERVRNDLFYNRFLPGTIRESIVWFYEDLIENFNNRLSENKSWLASEGYAYYD